MKITTHVFAAVLLLLVPRTLNAQLPRLKLFFPPLPVRIFFS